MYTFHFHYCDSNFLSILDLTCVNPQGTEFPGLAGISDIACVRDHANFKLQPDVNTLISAPWANGTAKCKVAQVICNARYCSNMIAPYIGLMTSTCKTLSHNFTDAPMWQSPKGKRAITH